MNDVISNPTSHWLRLCLTMDQTAIQLVQDSLNFQAKLYRFPAKVRRRMQMAVEQAITTIAYLRYGHAKTNLQIIGRFEIDIGIEDETFWLIFTDFDLPYDLSSFSNLDNESISACPNKKILKALQQYVDTIKIHPPGIQGQQLDLGWHMNALDHHFMHPRDQICQTCLDVRAEHEIVLREFNDRDAIYIARLMHQNYGYTYVNPDIYVAEKIQAKHKSETLKSVVAHVSAIENQVIGHCAFMKSHGDDPVVELGAAAVSPHFQGLGILNSLWHMLENELPSRPEKLAMVHAVTNHIYTQKVVVKYNYVFSALMMGYTPATIALSNQKVTAHQQRGSVFYCCKLLKNEPLRSIYLPPESSLWFKDLLNKLNMPFEVVCTDGHEIYADQTEFQYQVEPSLNISYLFCKSWGRNGKQALRKIIKFLCRQKIDVICAMVDLTHPSSLDYSRSLINADFFTGGITPYMPYPITALYQFHCHQFYDEQQIQTFSAEADTLKHQVFHKYREIECVDD